MEYVYEGEYYRIDAPRKQQILLKVVHTVLFLLALGIHLAAMANGAGANACWYISVPEIGMLFVYLGLGICIYERITARQKQTVWEYRLSAVSLKEFDLIGGVTAALTSVLVVVYQLVQGGDGKGWLTALLLAVTAILLGSGLALEKRTVYRAEVSDDIPKGIDITADFGPADRFL